MITFTKGNLDKVEPQSKRWSIQDGENHVEACLINSSRISETGYMDTAFRNCTSALL